MADTVHSIRILLVEDNIGDITLAKKAFSRSKFDNEIIVATDGEEALKILKQEGDYSNQKSPDLILLDLNLPKIDGFTVLKQIKSDKELKKIPVVILTTSKADSDIIKTYNDYANGFITKPIKMDDFVEIIHGLENYWFSIVQRPPVS